MATSPDPTAAPPAIDRTRGDKPKLPDFCIIGAMRSGTTSLSRYLGAHPSVFVPDVKECHYFDHYHDRGTSWYAGFFADALPGQVVGEATPNYLHEADAPARMWAEIPNARLIAVLRNPVDRAYSHYWHRRARGNEPLSFEEAIDTEPARLARGDPATRAFHSYVSRGLYADQLERFLDFYPVTSLLVISFESLRDRPADTFRDVCSFLGVERTIVPDVVGRQLNPHIKFRALALRDLAKHAPRPLSRVLGRLNVAQATYPAMDPITRVRLQERFAEPNRRLARLMGLDVSEWSR